MSSNFRRRFSQTLLANIQLYEKARLFCSHPIDRLHSSCRKVES